MGRRLGLWLAVAALAATAVLPSAALAAPTAFVYATANGSAEVLGYHADDTGLLAALAPPSVATGTRPAGIALSPDGSSLYVANQADATLSQYDVGAGGSLTPKSPATVATGASPLGVAVSADGEHVYVANQGDGTVSVFNVLGGGALSPTSSVAAGDGAASVALAPDGRHAYVTAFSSAEVAQFAVGGDGSLSPLTPARVGAGSAPFEIVLSADGSSAYVSDQSVAGSVLQFDVAGDGRLTPKATPSVAAGRLPAGLAIGAGGVYVANFGSGTISQYDVGAGGGLTPKAVPEVGSGLNPWGLTLAPDGTSLYVANFGAASISQFDVDAAGGLAPKSAGAISAGARPVALAVAAAPDTTAPTIDLRTPPEGAVYRVGDDILADYACADRGGSGLASCTGSVVAGAPLDTSHAGQLSFTVVARDGVGNQTTVTHSYRIEGPPLPWGGFRRPLVAPPRLNVRHAGDDIDIRFFLGGFQGLSVLAPGAPSYARVRCDDPSVQIGETRPAKSARQPRLRFIAGAYRFVWDTKTRWANTCRRFTLTLADGSTHELLFKLRKRDPDDDHDHDDRWAHAAWAWRLALSRR